jgi:hypothetical protein
MVLLLFGHNPHAEKEVSNRKAYRLRLPSLVSPLLLHKFPSKLRDENALRSFLAMLESPAYWKAEWTTGENSEKIVLLLRDVMGIEYTMVREKLLRPATVRYTVDVQPVLGENIRVSKTVSERLFRWCSRQIMSDWDVLQQSDLAGAGVSGAAGKQRDATSNEEVGRADNGSTGVAGGSGLIETGRKAVDKAAVVVAVGTAVAASSPAVARLAGPPEPERKVDRAVADAGAVADGTKNLASSAPAGSLPSGATVVVNAGPKVEPATAAVLAAGRGEAGARPESVGGADGAWGDDHAPSSRDTISVLLPLRLLVYD